MANNRDLEKKIFHNTDSRYFGKEDKIKAARAYAKEYMAFIGSSKIEREALANAVKLIEEDGSPYVYGEELKVGQVAYLNNRNKSLIAVRRGRKDLEEGLRILAAHIESPRLDTKPNSVYEDSGLALIKTHYYGGIKKYQWTAIPLAMHGTVALKDGSTVKITIGEDDDERCFCATDLLPHLAYKLQADRKEAEVIKGEELNILAASIPEQDTEYKDPVKFALLKYLYEQYGITEDDLITSDIEFVPAFRPRYLGVDESMIGAYGQDDKVCAYAALRAFCAVKDPEYTTLLVLADREEIGSEGNTGLNSHMLFNFISDLCRSNGSYPDIVLTRSKCISSDVSAAYDPTFSGVYEVRNAAKMNCGISVEKYTGARGKASTSEAPAEYFAWIRNVLDTNEVPWQADELGKVDEGGGGTVAKFIAGLGPDVIDIGVPVLSMHAPFEVTGIFDAYALFEADRSFLAF